MMPKIKLVTAAVVLLIILIVVAIAFRERGPISGGASPQTVLNEIRFDPVPGEPQYVEMKSVSGGSLGGWTLSNERGQSFALDAAPLGAGELLLVVFDGGNRVDGRVVRADRDEFLDPESGFIELADAAGTVVDRVAWGAEQGGGVNLGHGGAHGEWLPGTTVGRYPLSVTPNAFLEWLAFEPAAASPGAPNRAPRVEMLLPIDGALFVATSAELSWYPVAGADRYRVQIATDAAFNDLVDDRSVEEPLLQTPTLAAGLYYWRVQAVFADDSSADFSPASSFTLSATELPAAGAQPAAGFARNAGGVDLVPPRREAVLAVPLIYQHKDTAMLLLESQHEAGEHAWDVDHKTLDRTDPADNMNCALAAAAMVNNFAGGDLSQDRLGYEVRHAAVADNPAWDLNYGRGLRLDEINAVLRFAFDGAAVTRHGAAATAETLWETVTHEIDAERPVIVRASGPTASAPGHAVVIAGYYELSLTGPNARFVTVNDPWSGRYLVNVTRMQERLTHYWTLSSTTDPARSEDSIAQDSDGDGIVDFDELNRFKTLTSDTDSDRDEVPDKLEVYASVFDPNDGYAALGTYSYSRDRDGDRKFMESDPDSDGGGCRDGLEDRNANGRRDDGETGNFDEADDDCGPAPLGGLVKMAYDYSATRRALCVGRVEIEARFVLQPVVAPESPESVTTFRADELTYDIRTDGCADHPDDDLVYTYNEGLHLAGTIPLTEENLGYVTFFPAFPEFSMQLPSDITYLNDVNKLTGSYTMADGTVFPAETYVVFEALTVASNPVYCADGAAGMAADKLDFCTEPTRCANQVDVPVECYTAPQRFYVLPFEKSFRWDASNEPGQEYHIADVDVTVQICEGCGP